MKTKQIKQIKQYFFKRSVKSVVVTDLGFETHIELIGFKGQYIGSKMIPWYERNKELISLGF